MTYQQGDAYIARHDVGEVETWREDLAHVNELAQIVRDREPRPGDGAALLKHELRRALSASLFPEEAETFFDAVTRGAGAAGVAVLSHKRWRLYDDEGVIVLAEPGRPPRAVPVGDEGISYPEWVQGFALAATARAADALNILCTPASIAACSLPEDVIDTFWPFYCSALAAIAVEPPAAATWVADAESTLDAARIADPSVIELRVRPTLALVRALADADSASFNDALRAALEAHKKYFTEPDGGRDWSGLLHVEAVALAALAFERGLEVRVESDYLPKTLVRGEFPRALSKLVYHYPRRSIASAHEAHWFLDLEGFPRANRSHRLVEIGGQLIAQYEAHGAPGMPQSRAEFVLAEPEDAARGDSAGLSSPALDAGELLYLAEVFASETGDEGDSVATLRRRRAQLADAVSCVETALARIPPGRDAIDPAAITSARGRAVYEDEPGRFRRARMEAYLGALREALKRLDAEIEGKLGGGSEPRTQAGGGEADAGAQEDWARLAAAGTIDLICAEVMPILAAIARDETRTVVEQLAPRDEDYERVFVGEAVEAARRAYRDIWAQGIKVQYPTSLQTEIRCHAAPAGMLGEDNELSRRFPGGYRAIADQLNPHRVWLAWKYVRPGEQAGMSYDGLVWIEDHWAWFPKPYRVLK